jgi:hypothetical protein
MLVLADDQGTLVIGQLSHAWISGQLARAWGNRTFPPAQPREAVALGAEQHDIGWARVDPAPQLNPDTGRPRNFLEMTVEQHLSIWRDAPDLLASQSLRAALVVSVHGRSLSELRARLAPEDAQALEAHIRDEQARQARWCELLAVPEPDLVRLRRQMWTWDGISLALCNRWRPFTAKDVPTHEGLVDIELRERPDGGTTIDPWPLSEPRIELRCEARRIAACYEDEAEMRRDLESARPVELRFELVA